jgi:hypothetical protein
MATLGMEGGPGKPDDLSVAHMRANAAEDVAIAHVDFAALQTQGRNRVPRPRNLALPGAF